MKQAGVPIDYVLEIDVPDSEIIQRMSGRRVHPASGRSYHVEFNPPNREGHADVTREPVGHRDHNSEATGRDSLDVYRDQTSPRVAYYQARGAPRSAGLPKFRSATGL